MKKKLSIVLAGILFLAGLSLLLYPLVANQWNNYRQSRLISEYESVVKDESRKGTINYEKEWERADAYNQSLLPSILPDSFAIAAASDKPGEEYMSCLNILTDEMMGYVEVPKINIKIPIFHTTSEEVLSKGAGHLEGSSLPVGGENTHSVISAHRGLPSASLFTDLDQLEDGDHFLIRVLDQTLCYEVDQIHIVEPENTSDLAVEPGQDLVTLLTCTPYGVNTKRLLVRGHRVPYEEETIEKEEKESPMSLYTNYLLWVVVGLAVTAVLIIFLWQYDKRYKRKMKEKQAAANCLQVSLDKGEVTTLPTVNTIADGTAVKTPGEHVFPYLQKNLDDVITVEDDELIVSFLDMVENHKMIVENSGLLTVAALKHLNVKGKKVVSVLSGGNMDVITMASVVQLGLIQRDRIFTISVLLPDRPGELTKVSQKIAEQQGNIIKLDHNQFYSTNRNAAVELKITMEAFGTEHKQQIMQELEKDGYRPKLIRTNL